MASDYGVQDDGAFRRKHVDTIREDLKRLFKNELGEDIELRPNSPLTQIIDAAAIELARQWQASEDAYYASFYQEAEGEELDKHLALAGYQRKRLRPATGEVEFSCSDPAPNDIPIPEGTVVTTTRTQTRPRIPFETTQDTEIPAGETSATAPIKALKPWQTELDIKWLGEETNVAADTITRFENAIAGVDAVTNPDSTGDTSLGYVEGRDRETDPEFRLRYENSLAQGGVSTVDAIRGSLLNESDDLEETVQLVGKDALPDRDRLTLEIGDMLKEFYLQQNAFDPVDQYSSPQKTFDILQVILDWADHSYDALEDGALVEDLVSLDSRTEIGRVNTAENHQEKLGQVREIMEEEFRQVVPQ